MANILYVHGFNSNGKSGSFLALKEAFPEDNFFSDDFDLLDVKGTLAKIDHLCRENEIDLLIGKSLGGFYTLAYDGELERVVINPCIKPWIEIPKLDPSVSQSVLNEWKDLFVRTQANIRSDQRIRTFGIFGDEDELFSYKDYFDENYDDVCVSLKKSFFVPGKHHIDIEPLQIAIQKSFDYFYMMMAYDEVFSLMPLYQLIKDSDDSTTLNISEEEKQSIRDAVNQYHNMMISYQEDKIFDSLNK